MDESKYTKHNQLCILKYLILEMFFIHHEDFLNMVETMCILEIIFKYHTDSNNIIPNVILGGNTKENQDFKNASIQCKVKYLPSNDWFVKVFYGT